MPKESTVRSPELPENGHEMSRDHPVVVPAQAVPGDTLDHIDTPALVLDLDLFEENLRTLQALAERHGVAVRAHAKAHKCPQVALRQIALGAVGICCQKVSEAVPFVNAGVRDVLITNEVVGGQKLDLLAHLARHAHVMVCADHPTALQALSDTMVAHKASVGVLIEVDVGQKRCGVQTPDHVVELARQVQALPQLVFRGIQAYHGGLQHKRSAQAREHACATVADRVRRVLAALQRAGIECPVVSGGGTGTVAFDIPSGVFTEVQPGSYAFMDTDYAANDWGETVAFRHAVYLLGTVMSTPAPGRAVVDVGLKSASAESGVPTLLDCPDVQAVSISDEHTVLHANDTAILPALGAKVRLLPSHCDPTFNLHDQVVCVRNNKVEALWPVLARGLSR